MEKILLNFQQTEFKDYEFKATANVCISKRESFV